MNFGRIFKQFALQVIVSCQDTYKGCQQSTIAKICVGTFFFLYFKFGQNMLNTRSCIREGTNERTPRPNTIPLFYYVVG